LRALRNTLHGRAPLAIKEYPERGSEKSQTLREELGKED